jgi:hypothetical protein
MRGSRIITGFVVTALSFVATTAGASGELGPRAGLDSRIPCMALTRDRQKQEAYSSQTGWLGFRSNYGQDWQVLWRESTGTPHRAYGGSIRLLPAGKLTEASVTSACRQFMESNSDLLKARVEDLSVGKVVNVLGKWGVIYKQQYRDIDVYGGRVDFRVARDGTLLYFGSDFYPGIDVSVTPTIPSEQAIEVARATFTGPVSEGSCDADDLVIFPQEDSEGVTYHLAYRIHVSCAGPLGQWIVFVDAHSGEALWRTNQLKTDIISGTFHGHIRPFYEGDTPVDEPFGCQAVYLADVDSVVFEDLAQDPDNWYIDPPWGQADFYGCPEPGNSWDENSGEFYPPVLNSSLSSKYISPGISDKTPVLSFCHRYSLGLSPDSGRPSQDFCNVELRPSQESAWKLLRRYTGKEGKCLEQVSLGGLLTGDAFQVRFRFESDANFEDQGWNIDNVVVHYRSRDLTDSQGLFDFNSNSQQRVSARLQGPGVEVIRYGYESGFVDRTATPGVPLDINWDNYATAHERNVYYHVTRAMNHIGELDLSMMIELTERPMPVIVGVPLVRENAYWDPTLGGLGFSERLTLYADVIYHEYAHGVTDHIYTYWKPLDDMHEGFSDYWACTLTNDAQLGEQGGLSSPRELENDLEFPDDFFFQVDYIHYNGQIIGGAMWDTRENLISKLGTAGVARADSLFHFARYFEPFDFEDFYFDVLFVDEDDSNPNNGTPNMLEIADAFGRHGIGPNDEIVADGYDIAEVTLIGDNDGIQIGDADGIVDSGEYGSLMVSLRNYGVARTNVSVMLEGNCDVLAGTSSYGDMATGAVAQPLSGEPFLFQVPLSGLRVGSTLDFSLNITADGGYSHTEHIRTNVGEAPVLVVDDMPTWFRNLTDPWDLMEIYEESLNNLGINYGTWRVQEYGIPSVSELQKYGCVLWYTGADRAVCVSHTEADTLSRFLDNTPGAALFITGQDIGMTAFYSGPYVATWDNPWSQAFYRDYLKAELRGDSPYPFTGIVEGVSGDPIGNGLAAEIDRVCPNGCGDYTRVPDIIGASDALPPAQPVFTYDTGDTAAIRWEGDYRLVYMAFGWEAINEPAMRDTVMCRIVDWLAPGIGTRVEAELASSDPFCPGGDGNTLTLRIGARNEDSTPKQQTELQVNYGSDLSYEGVPPEFGPIITGSCRLGKPIGETDSNGDAQTDISRLGGCGRIPYEVVDLDHNIAIYRGNAPAIKSYDIDASGDCIINDLDTGIFTYYEQADSLCADFDGNGSVGLSDLIRLLGHYGHFSVCPENSSVWLTQSDECLAMCPGGDLSNPDYPAEEFVVHQELRSTLDAVMFQVPADSILLTLPQPASSPFQGENFQFVCRPNNTSAVADSGTDGYGHATTTISRAGGYGIDRPVTVLVDDGDPAGPLEIGEVEISPKSPDIDASGRVDARDIMVYSVDLQGGGHHRSDMDCSGSVDDDDLLYINGHYLDSCGDAATPADGGGGTSSWPQDVVDGIRGAVPNVILDRWLRYELHAALRALLEHVRSLAEPEGLAQGHPEAAEETLSPEVSGLSQNYPNPMTVATIIHYQVALPGGRVQIRIYDAAGRLVRELVDENLAPNYYSIAWDGRDDQGRQVPNGVYFYQMKTPGFSSNKRMMLVR